MAQIIMGLNGLPANLTVSTKNFRADADKKRERGRLDLTVYCSTADTSKRVQFTAATKCEKQEGKCKKRDCRKWHWQPMDAGSVREPMLETQRDVKKHLKAVAGKQLTFTLSAGIANGVSDMIAQDDELYYGTVGTIG